MKLGSFVDNWVGALQGVRYSLHYGVLLGAGCSDNYKKILSMTIPEDGVNKAPVEAPKDQLENLFTYHSPTEDQIGKYANLRLAALDFARVIHENVPESPDRTAAIRLVREAVMTANAGIATGGGFYR